MKNEARNKNNVIYYLLWGLMAVVFFPVFRSLYTYRWDALGYTHAFFILPISIGLAYWKKEELAEAFRKTRKKFGIANLIVFVFGILLYLFGWHQDYMVISTFAVIPTLYGLLGFIYGGMVQRALLFPVLYLLLLVPPPFSLLDKVTLPLRYISAFGVEKIFQLLRFPIQREGLMYVISGKQMMIDEACSGLRSLVTMFALVLPYVYLIKCKLTKKTVLISSVIPLALVGNIARIIVISLMSLYLGTEVAQGFMHYFSGAVVFLFIILGFLGIEAIWTKVAGKKKPDKGDEFEWF